MAAVSKFKNYIAAKLGQMLRVEIAPTEVTLTNPRSSTGAFSSLIDVTYKGKVYPLAYNKFDIGKLFYGMTALKYTTTEITLHAILPLVNARFGLMLAPTDVEDTPLRIGCPVVMTPECLEYTGQFTLDVSLPETVERPYHKFMLDGNGANTGISTVPITAAFDYVSFADKTWASVPLATPLPLGAGVDLDMRTDFTLDFECVVNSTGTQYSTMFTQDAAGSTTLVGNIVTRVESGLHNNKPVIQGVGYTGPADSLFPQLVNDTPTRITIVREGNVYRWYKDGTLVWTLTSAVKIANALKYWGSKIKRSKQYLRALSYWTRALTAAELNELHGTSPTYPMPRYEWLLQDDLKSTGSDTTALTGNIVLATDAKGKWARFGSTAHIPFPAGLTLPKNVDYTLDFEVMFTSIPNYACFLTTSGGAAGAVGSFWWYNGKLYEYGVSSGNANIPVAVANTPQRVTMVRSGSKVSMYLNGKLAQEYAPGGSSPLIGFHDGDISGYQFPTTAGFRKLRYWTEALNAEALAALFAV